MIRPTREQTDAARQIVDMMHDAAQSGHALWLSQEERDALRTLLAATTPPTDEELTQEAERITDARYLTGDVPRGPRVAYARGYLAGARREGRR